MALVIHKVPENLITNEKPPKGTCPRMIPIVLFDKPEELDIWGLELDKDYEYSYTQEELLKNEKLYNYLAKDRDYSLCESCIDKELQKELSNDIDRY